MRLLVGLVDWLFVVYSWLLLARVLLSWLPVDPYNPAIRLLVRITDPALRPFRRLLPPLGGVDFSPVVAFLALSLVRSVVVRLLGGVGA